MVQGKPIEVLVPEYPAEEYPVTVEFEGKVGTLEAEIGREFHEIMETVEHRLTDEHYSLLLEYLLVAECWPPSRDD